MRAYLVTATIPAAKGSDDEPVKFSEYAGKQADAAAIKKSVFETHRDAGLKRSSIEVDEVEIPTDKAGLIAWINSNLR